MICLFVAVCFLSSALSQVVLPLPVSLSYGVAYDPAIANCTTYDSNGTESTIPYDTCVSFCCGGAIVPKNSSFKCCGSKEHGSPYHPQMEQCCQWWTGYGRAYLKSDMKNGYGCCGIERIFWPSARQGCCYGDGNLPSVYDPTTSLCCNTKAVPFHTVHRWESRCCGDSASYNPNLQSCPCDDGTVVSAKSDKTACCVTPGGGKIAYNVDTEFCCLGEVGKIGVDFCCGDSGIGTTGEQVCCDDVIVPVNPPNKNATACCDDIAYDPNVNLCCKGNVLPIEEGENECCGVTPYNPLKSICCGESLWSTETEGTECCGAEAFFPGGGSFCCEHVIYTTSPEVPGDACCVSGDVIQFYFKDGDMICCNGVLSERTLGDSCCGTSPYSNKSSICCDGIIRSKLKGNTCCHDQPYFPVHQHKHSTICCEKGPYGPFKTPSCCGGVGFDTEGGTLCCGGKVYGRFSWPSCCVDVGYDAKTATCCGSTVYQNHGSRSVSCCGVYAYDRNTELCCQGYNASLPEGTPPSRGACCGVDAYNIDTQLCCGGVVMNKTFQFNSKCCGYEVYDDTQQICCSEEGMEPVLYDREFGENSKCCGIDQYDDTAEFCCDGYLRPKEFDESACCAGIVYDKTKNICCRHFLQKISPNVPYEFAECCGWKCYYREKQNCCFDKIYQDNARTNVTCSDF